MKFLKTALLLNASSCLIFGLIFLLFGEAVSSFIGSQYPWLVPSLGLVLLINGIHLVLASRRNRPICPEILYFVLGDMLWVLATIALVVLGVIITSVQGVIVSLLVAAMVATFGFMQVKGYKMVCSA